MLLFYEVITYIGQIVGSFNTSHVTVLRMCADKDIAEAVSFNTSHVTVLQKSSKRKKTTYSVSIHLMLLFYLEKDVLYKQEHQSFNTSHVTVLLHQIQLKDLANYRFNTSHVTVLLRLTDLKRLVSSVSIHLMLLFYA